MENNARRHRINNFLPVVPAHTEETTEVSTEVSTDIPVTEDKNEEDVGAEIPVDEEDFEHNKVEVEATLEIIKQILELKSKLYKSKEEKNTAYESLKSINETKGLEEQIETMLKDEFKYDSFVKISKDQINIVISSSEHNKDIANNIIKKVQSMYNTKKYITIKFQ